MLKKIILGMLLIIGLANASSRDKDRYEMGNFKYTYAKEVCIQGKAYIIARANKSVAVTQVFEAKNNGYTTVPKPKKCK